MDRVAGASQRARHRAAHDSETDDADRLPHARRLIMME
jgi:hypothetical protein